MFRNSGQICVAGSRLIVQASVYERFMEELLNVTAKLRVGDPLELTSDVGAISSKEQLRKNLDSWHWPSEKAPTGCAAASKSLPRPGEISWRQPSLPA